jgi:hypothetical protein
MDKDLFKDKLKVDGSKKHLQFRPAYAKIDKKQGLVTFWDYGPNYDSFNEMSLQRKEISHERIFTGLNSNPGLQFANRGICVAMILGYKGDEYLVASCKRNSKALATINGYFGNGINADLECKSEVPKDINVADPILRTATIEVLEEFNAVFDQEILRGEVKITDNSFPVSFTPFKKIFQYSDKIKYKVTPLEGRLECLTNLHEFPVAKTSSAEDKNPILMGKNIGIYFDSFHNCYQIVASVKTEIKETEFIFQTEDRYRDNIGMDTFLYLDGIKLIRLNDKRKMTREVYQIKRNGELEKVPIEGLEVLDPLIPKNPETETIIAKSLFFKDVIKYQHT